MYKILLVEDNEMNRDMLSRRLEMEGYKVEFAVNGQEASEKALSYQPDLILMDLNLPVINGWDATQNIKSRNETAHIPVIALTAHAFTEDKEKALQAGCDDYDTKPVDFKRLQQKMNKFLKPDY